MLALLHRRLASSFAFFALAALTLLAACDLGGLDPGQRPAPRRDEPAHTQGARARRPHPGRAPSAESPDDSDAPQFAPGQLEQHFRKHGADMGFATMADYLHAAQALVAGGPGVETLERDGDTLFYRPSTGEFGVLSSRNVIRTYFRPDDPPAYWERQKQR